MKSAANAQVMSAAKRLGYRPNAMASVTLSAKLAKSCRDAGVPVVLFNRVPDLSALARRSICSVPSDNHRGGHVAAQLLLQRGHHRIAFLTGMDGTSTNSERARGCNEALRDAGIAVFRRAVGHYDFDLAKAATHTLYAGARRPDAVFVANDHMAIAAMDVLRNERGLRLPQDVGLVGFDDVPQPAWGACQLTTIAQSVPDMVDATVTLRCEQMQENSPTRNVVIPCRLVERVTVRPAAPD